MTTKKQTSSKKKKAPPPIPANQPAAAAPDGGPAQPKTIDCAVHGPVQSTVLSTTERTQYSVALYDIVHLCPHCYITALANMMGTKIENPKPIMVREDADN